MALIEFEFYKGGSKKLGGKVVVLGKSGNITLSSDVVDATKLKDEDWVVIGINKEHKKIQIKPATEDVAGARKFYIKKGQGYIDAKTPMAYWGITLETGKRCRSVAADQAMIIFAFDDDKTEDCVPVGSHKGKK